MKESVKAIKRELRLAMNGVVSSSMRNKGMDYKLNFGVASPSLVGIAQKFTPSAPLAELLWSESVRECRIMATLLYPIEEYSADVAHRWMETADNPELIDLWCFHLLHRLAYAEELVFNWLPTENPFARQTALSLASRLLIKRECSTEFPQQLICAIARAEPGALSEHRVINCVDQLLAHYAHHRALILQLLSNSSLSAEAKEEIKALDAFFSTEQESKLP